MKESVHIQHGVQAVPFQLEDYEHYDMLLVEETSRVEKSLQMDPNRGEEVVKNTYNDTSMTSAPVYLKVLPISN